MRVYYKRVQRERSDDESGGDQGNDLQFWPTSRDPGSQFPAYFAKRKMKERRILITMQSKHQKGGLGLSLWRARSTLFSPKGEDDLIQPKAAEFLVQ